LRFQTKRKRFFFFAPLRLGVGAGDDGGGEAAAEGRRRWENLLADRISLLVGLQVEYS
jgi:hypothetical protein